MTQARANLQTMTEAGEVAEGKKILIVDDEAYNCDVLSAIISSLKLENCSERIDRCLSGHEALELLEKNIVLA